MTAEDGLLFDPSRGRTLAQGALSFCIGVAITFGLFYTIAHFESDQAPVNTMEIDDLRAVQVPLEPPPPPPQVTPNVEPVTMVTGFDLGPSESVVKIMVTPPDLDAILPPPPAAPPARIEIGKLYTEFKPKMMMQGLEQRIYQASEVDQPPLVLDHVVPKLTLNMRENATALRITFLIVIDLDGSVKSIRIAKGSGNADFDALMAKTMPLWTFSPAIRRGKKVKCLIEQSLHFTFSNTTAPFSS